MRQAHASLPGRSISLMRTIPPPVTNRNLTCAETRLKQVETALAARRHSVKTLTSCLFDDQIGPSIPGSVRVQPRLQPDRFQSRGSPAQPDWPRDRIHSIRGTATRSGMSRYPRPSKSRASFPRLNRVGMRGP